MRRILCACVALGFVGQLEAQPRSTGKWLTDLGRDYPLSPQAGLSDADAELTRLFMAAAARVEPGLAEPYLWQFDMLTALGRPEEARQALKDYVARAPEDVSARLRWIALRVQVLQTSEERAELCRQLLEEGDLPGPVAGDLQARLAGHYANQGQYSQAHEAAVAALLADPTNVAARALRNRVRRRIEAGEGFKEDWREQASQQAEELLARLEVCPADGAAAWGLGNLLAELGQYERAEPWYEHAAGVIALRPPGAAPAALRSDQAEALLGAGKLERARTLLTDVLDAEPEAVDALIALARLQVREGQADAARATLDRAAAVYKGALLRPAEDVGPEVLAAVAWFFAHVDPEPREAEQLARAALAEWPESVVARRALGAAQRQLDQETVARKTLEPVAEADAWAGIELARTLAALDDRKAADAALRGLIEGPLSPAQRDEVLRLAGEWGLAFASSRPSLSALTPMLEAFPREVLDYPFHPETYLSLTLSTPRPELAPGEPWWCTFRVANKGAFPVRIGAGRMVSGDALCAVQATGDAQRGSGPILHLTLGRRPVLMPGDSLEVRQTLDVGPLRGSMIGTPQVSHAVEVTCVLSPLVMVSAEGREVWAPDVGGLLAEPLKFTRTAFPYSPRSFGELLARVRSGEVEVRIDAVRLLAMLLAEDQHLSAGRLRYGARRVDAAAAQAAVLAATKDPEWRVRACAAECLRWFVLDATARQAAIEMRMDPHWLVRGLALRTLVDHLGERVRPVLENHVDADPDAWVRQFARALLDRMTPATQPAGG